MQFAIVEPQRVSAEALSFGRPMPSQLAISIGQHSDKGRKEANQDFHGALIPEEPLLGLKGIAVVLADGISTSDVSAIASESAVKSFLTDYYCTSDSWSVKTSAHRVIAATNSWLHATKTGATCAHSAPWSSSRRRRTSSISVMPASTASPGTTSNN
jgi:serine/threonine protein phosphatase PrpC